MDPGAESSVTSVMTTLGNQDLIRLLQGCESDHSDHVEFKNSLSSDTRNDIQEAICAFANDLPDHREPGVIFVGARDDGSISGLPVTDELLRQLAGMKTEGNIVPPPSILVQKLSLDDGDVAVVIVHPSDSPPVRYRGRVHLRIGPRRGTATAQDERVLNEKRRYGDIPFDIYPIPSATLNDLNLLQFEYEYLPQAFHRDVLEANDRSIEERLAATKMVASADDPVPTVLGILLLGKSPQDFLPGAYVQFLKLDGDELLDDIADSEDIRGAIPDVLRRLDEKLNGHNRIAVDIISASTERRTNTYPIRAIQQITRNAIMHRTYEATNAPVKVHWFNDRIEIISPGGPFGGVSASNFGQPGLTDYAHSISDSIEGITHSLCSMEYENHRPLYDWFLEELDIYRPQQIEFARFNISHTVLSKRRLIRLVEDGHVDGWDDPRMPTLAGLRRRGYTPDALRSFYAEVGINRTSSLTEMALLEHSLRDDLNRRAARRMAVLNPLKVVIENFPEGETDYLDAVNNPEDESAGTRRVPFSREIYVERDDFMEDPPRRFYRLAPGREVRLRYGYFIKCEEAVKDETGNVVELRCTYDPETRGGSAPDGRRVRATLHWVSAKHAVDAEVRLYDSLFTVPNPNDTPDGREWTDFINTDSLSVLSGCKIEPSLADSEAGETFQFERIGYFAKDRDSTADTPVFNRAVSLRDTWARIQRRGG